MSAYGRVGVSAYGNFEDNAFLSENYEPTLTTDNYSATGTVLKVETARTEDTEDTEVLKG